MLLKGRIENKGGHRCFYVNGEPPQRDEDLQIEEAISAEPRAYRHPRVSPDGTRVAVDITDEDSSDIWIWDLELKTLSQFTFDEGVDDFPAPRELSSADETP